MYEQETLSIRGSALPIHTAAIREFIKTDISDVDPSIVERVDYRPDSEVILANRTLRTIGTLLETGADQYIDFGARVDEMTRTHEEAWRLVNLSSSASAEQDSAARMQWRLARIASYITLAQTNDASVFKKSGTLAA
jgi:hypothetical protein